MRRGFRSPGGGSRGFRLLRRLLTFAGLVAAAAAAVVAARRRREAASRAPALATPPAASLPPPNRPAPAARPSAGAARRTRQELYREAQALGLKGRSKMTKAELERALREHADD
jgi:hypothetical protein